MFPDYENHFGWKHIQSPGRIAGQGTELIETISLLRVLFPATS